jgi:drug/metabolite transporter (DMT)-like permease
MTDSASRRSALIALAITSLIWSYNWVVMKSVLVYIGPLTFSALRYVLGTAVLFLLLRLRGESMAPTPWRDTILIGLAQTTGFQALVQLALVAGGAGKTALLAYTMPFWVIPFSWLLLGDRPGARQWVCIGLAVTGFVLVLEPWRTLGGTMSALLALAGGACWAAGTVLSKRLFRDAAVSALRLTAWQMLIGTLGLVAITLYAHERPIDWSPTLYAALAYNGVLSSGAAWALWLFVVQRLPANVAGLASLVTPLLGVLFAWVLLNERPDPPEAAGIALIALALLGVLRPRAAV